MTKEEIISFRVDLVDGKFELTGRAKEGYDDFLRTTVGMLTSYFESKQIARPKEDIGYEVYLVKAKMTIYAGDVEAKSEERQKEKYMKLKDYPNFPISLDQLEEVKIEPHSNVIGEPKDVEVIMTGDGEYREVVQDQEVFTIYKIPRKFHLDIREVEELVGVLEAGLGEYGSFEMLELRRLGKNYY